MFENYRVFKTDYAGRELTIETGKMCGLANGSCLVRYGDRTGSGLRRLNPLGRNGFTLAGLRRG